MHSSIWPAWMCRGTHRRSGCARRLHFAPGRAAARPARGPRLHRAHTRYDRTLHRHRRRYSALARGGEPHELRTRRPPLRRRGCRAVGAWFRSDPSWWLECVTHLLALRPAAAWIACDPDPAGIEIALKVGRLWEECGSPGSGRSNAGGAPKHEAARSSDRERLRRLRQRSLPADLGELAEWMLAHNRKCEQEGVL